MNSSYSYSYTFRMLLFYGATACRFVYPQIERSTKVVAAVTKNSASNKIVVSNKERAFLPSIGKSGGICGTRFRFTSALIVAAVTVMIVVVGAANSNYANASDRKQQQQQQQEESSSSQETFANIPQLLSGECSDSSSEILSSSKDCKKVRIQRPKSRKAETCTIKCVTTCIRGGLGSPGEGPFNIRR